MSQAFHPILQFCCQCDWNVTLRRTTCVTSCIYASVYHSIFSIHPCLFKIFKTMYVVTDTKFPTNIPKHNGNNNPITHGILHWPEQNIKEPDKMRWNAGYGLSVNFPIVGQYNIFLWGRISTHGLCSWFFFYFSTFLSILLGFDDKSVDCATRGQIVQQDFIGLYYKVSLPCFSQYTSVDTILPVTCHCVQYSFPGEIRHSLTLKEWAQKLRVRVKIGNLSLPWCWAIQLIPRFWNHFIDRVTPQTAVTLTPNKKCLHVLAVKRLNQCLNVHMKLYLC